MSAQTRSLKYPRLALAGATGVCLAMLWASAPRAASVEVLEIARAESAEMSGSDAVHDKPLDRDLGIKLLLHRHHAPVAPVSAPGHKG